LLKNPYRSKLSVMANFGLLVDDLKREIDSLPEESRERLIETIRDIFFVVRIHADSLDKIFSADFTASLRKTMIPHLQAIATDAIFGHLELDELPTALFEAFPAWKKVLEEPK
jgi:hypothetical protein